MSLLDRLRICDRHDLRDFRPFWIQGRRYGWVRPGFMQALLRRETVFHPAGGGVTLDDGLADYEARSQAVHAELVDMRAAGHVEGWYDEPSAVVESWGEPAALEIERAGLDAFGLKSFGVHLNGYVRTNLGTSLWIATRAPDRASFPGQLDHLAAGGQPLGLTPRENMVKESAEEAGVPAELAARMVAAGAIRYRCDLPEGLQDDCIFAYDLELPADFEPQNQDGEVASFELLPVADVILRLRRTDDFKFNVGPVILDFVLRHDLLPKRDAEYAAVAHALAAMRRPGA